MRVTFVRPSIHGTRTTDAMEPLAFAVLQGLTPSGVETALFDERLEAVPVQRPTDLAAITVETYTARRAYQLADAYRQRGVPVVMGGYHPTFLPDEALGHADSVVIGDAEPVWTTVLADAAGPGRLRPRYEADAFPDLAGVVYDRSIFEGKKYKRVLPVQYGRGCKFNCDFCSIRAFYGNSLRQRPPEEVAEEIRASGRRFVLLVDDNLFVDIPRAKALFDALVPLGIRWGCQVSIDVAHDAELMDLMARSGCIAALIGFESLDTDNLRQMRKGWSVKGLETADAIRRFQQRGIMIYGSFIFGYDHDTPDVFQRTADFARDQRLFLVNFSALQPTPGTALYDRLDAEGRLLFPTWWTDPAYRYGDAAFRPTGMTPQQLTDGCKAARTAFFGARSISRRAFSRTNAASPGRLAVYLGANLIARRELKTKLGRPLGGAGVKGAG